MRAAVRVIALLGLFLMGCSRNYSPKQIRVVTGEISLDISGALVNREFFTNSNAKPYLGRFFAEKEFHRNGPAVAVISYKVWQNMFRSRPEVIGSKVQFNDWQTIIIGVAAPDFAPGWAGELWVPKP